MDLRTRDYSTEQRKRLGDALTARRVAVSPAWANRAEFIRATGISKKLSERLETGEPGSYRTSTLAVVARAYRVKLESIAEALEGGELVPAAAEPEPSGEDAVVIVLNGALSRFERYVMDSDELSDAEKAALIAAHRKYGGEQVLAEMRRQLRTGR